MSDVDTPGPGRSMAALIGGFTLSFLAFGLLWIGTQWPVQTLMAVPFFGLTWLLVRGAPGSANQLLTFVLCGAGPLGLLMTKFRDKNDSHLTSILVVCSWVVGAALGWYVARRKS